MVEFFPKLCYSDFAMFPSIKCPVCSCDVGQDYSSCPDCDAIYHTDCWRYAGHCSIYGCQPLPSESLPHKNQPSGVIEYGSPVGLYFMKAALESVPFRSVVYQIRVVLASTIYQIVVILLVSLMYECARSSSSNLVLNILRGFMIVFLLCLAEAVGEFAT